MDELAASEVEDAMLKQALDAVEEEPLDTEVIKAKHSFFTAAENPGAPGHLLRAETVPAVNLVEVLEDFQQAL